MKLFDRLIDRVLSGALERRYRVSGDMVYMDARLPVTKADMAIMRAIARESNGIPRTTRTPAQ